MKSRTLTLIVAMTFSAALATAVRLTAQEQQEDKKEPHRYTVIDLGTLGGTFATGLGVNNEGWVTGFANLAGDENHHAFLWVNGVKTDLGTLGGPNSVGNSLNARGQVVGNAETSIPDPTGEDPCGNGTMLICPPFLWQKEVMTPLATLGGKNGSANGINERGDAVGTAENAFPDTTCLVGFVFAQTKPVIWVRGDIKELPTIDGDPDGIATSVNEHGQVVGASGNCTSLSHALLWQEGTVTDLGTLEGLQFVPLDINNAGQVVGFASSPDGTILVAFLWQNGVATSLGTLPPDVFSLALGINDKGQIVGDSCDMSFSCRAFLWQDGTMTELNTLVQSPNAPFLENANSIDSRGQIAGKTTVQGTPIADAFLAIPCDEEHAGDEVCADSAEGTNAVRGETSQRPRVVLPENVRKLLQRRLNPRFHFPGVKAGPMN
jgi:probable HAF family extracellular repeat protein